MDIDAGDFILIVVVFLAGVIVGALCVGAPAYTESPQEIENTKCVYYEKQIYCLKEENNE